MDDQERRKENGNESSWSFFGSSEELQEKIEQYNREGINFLYGSEDIFLEEIDTMTVIAKEIARQIEDVATARQIVAYVHRVLLDAEVFYQG